MKKISILLTVVSASFLNAQNIAFDKLYGNNDQNNFYLGHYPVTGSDGLAIKWYGGMRLMTSDGTALQILQNRNIGIGNIDPSEKLDISGNIFLRNTSNTAGAGNFINFSSINKDYGAQIRSSLQFASGNASKQALILSSFWEGYKDEITLIGGKVGIGTSIPTSTLTVFSNNGVGGNELELKTNHTRNDNRYFMKNIIRGMGNDDVTFSLRHDGEMFVDGNVGIGTNSPLSKLVIADNAGATVSITTNKINGSNITPLKPALEFLGFDNGKKARISALEKTYDTHGSALSFFVNDGGSSTSLVERMSILQSGNVGIGVSNPQNKLDVDGTIHSREVKVDLNGWADYVFKNDYELATLEEVESYIVEKGHLFNIPSADEVVKNGINLGEMDSKLLAKIEELTLYSIDLNKKNKTLDEKIQQQEQIINQLSRRMNQLEKQSH